MLKRLWISEWRARGKKEQGIHGSERWSLPRNQSWFPPQYRYAPRFWLFPHPSIHPSHPFPPLLPSFVSPSSQRHCRSLLLNITNIFTLRPFTYCTIYDVYKKKHPEGRWGACSPPFGWRGGRRRVSNALLWFLALVDVIAWILSSSWTSSRPSMDYIATVMTCFGAFSLVCAIFHPVDFMI